MHWSQFLLSLVIRTVALVTGLIISGSALRQLIRRWRATMPVTTSAGCPGQSSPACTCDGTCQPSTPRWCACPACAPVHGYAAGGIVQAGGAGGSSSHGSSAGGGGGGGGAGSSMGASFAPLSSFTALPPVPRGTGAGMTGFAEAGASEFEFAAGSVLGLRQWTLVSPDFRGDPHNAESNWPVIPLRGATGFAWPLGAQVLEAGCNNGYGHPPPVEVDPVTLTRCGCGWWAYWDMASLSANRPMSFSGSGLPVLGVIEGYGRVLLGERGFRSQKAKIAALAPAFSVRAELAWPQPSSDESLWDQPGRSASGDPYLVYAEQHKAAERAQLHADTWMAMIQDRLGQMYPGTQVFATVNGLLASVQTRGRPT
jgi:hypothetical protein